MKMQLFITLDKAKPDTENIRGLNLAAVMCMTVIETELSSFNKGVPQGSVLRLLLCLLYTAVVAMDSDPSIASQKLQTDLLAIQDWFKKWRLKANESKSIHVTFTARREMCPPVHINSVQFPREEDVKNLGLHHDRRLTWHKHIFASNIKILERFQSKALHMIVDAP
jgi:hypothetical protein